MQASSSCSETALQWPCSQLTVGDMCGRYTLTNPAAVKAALQRLGVKGADTLVLPLRYNVAPSQTLPVVIQAEARMVEMMPWGVYRESGPVYDRRVRFLTNARADSASRPGVWSDDVHHRRGLAVADGFYEWSTTCDVKVPYWITMKDRRPFWLAALFGPVKPGQGPGYTLMTTTPNELMEPIHDRMPVILDDAEAVLWLSPGPLSRERLKMLTGPYDAAAMEAVQVSTLVNKTANDLPECILPVGTGELF